MTTADQFLKALAVVESNDDPESWGDGGQAMGRWQVHPGRLFDELARNDIHPSNAETWDQLVARVLRAMFAKHGPDHSADEIAMYWHLGHWQGSAPTDWDAKYAARFNAALLNAAEEMP